MLTLMFHLKSMRWVASATFMLGTAPTYYAVWGTWRIASALLPSRLYEYGDEFLYSTYQRLILFFFENCSGVEVIFYGDIDSMLAQKENVVFISNHQCTVDWMVADMLAIRQGTLGNIRYILKDGLKYLPLYGYYFRQHSCVFIKRGGTFSEAKAERHLDAFNRNRTPFWMVVFPEGTRYNPMLTEYIAQSRTYARSRGWPMLNHVLAPRTKAVELCVQRLRGNASAVYDVTAAYSSTLAPPTRGLRTVAPSLADFLQGQCRQIHIHLRRIPIDEVPCEQKRFEDWVVACFSEKDRLLEEFYSPTGERRGTLGPDGRSLPLALRSTLPALCLFTALNAPLWGTATGRALCWKLALVGTLVSWAWVFVRS